MNKKMLLLLFIIAFAFTLLMVMWVMKGTAQTKLILQGAWNSLLSIPATISGYIQGFTSNTAGALATLGGIGGATTGALAVYKQLRTTKQQANEAISTVSGEAQQAKMQLTTAKQDLEALRTQTKTTLAEKDAEIQGLKTQLGTANEQLQSKEAEVQRYIGERNMEADMLSRATALQIPCRFCSKPTLPGQHYCHTCGRELITA